MTAASTLRGGNRLALSNKQPHRYASQCFPQRAKHLLREDYSDRKGVEVLVVPLRYLKAFRQIASENECISSKMHNNHATDIEETES